MTYMERVKQRRLQILDELKQDVPLSYGKLAAKYGVTVNTIYRIMRDDRDRNGNSAVPCGDLLPYNNQTKSDPADTDEQLEG